MMTTLLKSILLTSIFLLVSCTNNDLPTESRFCTNDPLQKIEWLKQLVNNEVNDTAPNANGLEIIQYEYLSNAAFSVNTCVNNCADATTKIYSCDQKLICKKEGISGIDTCTDFFKEAKNDTILFTTRTNLSSNCNKPVLINKSLFETSQSTPIIHAEINDNCLYLTFAISSTQDRIQDVDLIDSEEITGNLPTQRTLKLILKEDTNTTTVKTTTAFDISPLVPWDNTAPIILKIDGFDTPLEYQRTPQCGDPNFDCVVQYQSEEKNQKNLTHALANNVYTNYSILNMTSFETTYKKEKNILTS